MVRPLQILLILLYCGTQLSASGQYKGGARARALSGAFVSVPDVWGTAHNPATLAVLTNLSAGVHYESRFLLNELSLTALSLVVPLKSQCFGLSFYQFGYAQYQENKAGLAYAKTLARGLSAAVQFDYFWFRLPENEGARGFATFDAGLHYQFARQLSLGLHIFNPLQQGFSTYYGKAEMPYILRFGGHYKLAVNTIVLAEAENRPGKPILLRTGVEYQMVKDLALRIGVSGQPLVYSLGLGYSFNTISCNLAFAYQGRLGLTPAVSIEIKRP